MVQALQGGGHTVAMTGDGVNDVLALKDADIAIAMGSGSAVTRGVAQLVLLDDDFSVLPSVLAEGRRVLANVERVANLFLTKTAYALVIAVMVGITGYAYPFLPRHLTIIDDFTIGVPAFFLALLPNPTPFRRGFVDRVLRFTIPCGAIVGVAASIAYVLAHHAHRSLVVQRTMTTIVIGLCGLWVLSLLARPWDKARTALMLAVSAGFVGVLAVSQFRHFFSMHIPPAPQVLEMAVLVLVSGALLEVVDRHTRRRSAGPH
jgi:cation-transporting ATPase E